jgi:hypothetical protein
MSSRSCIAPAASARTLIQMAVMLFFLKFEDQVQDQVKD